jgi:hypothetical protein
MVPQKIPKINCTVHIQYIKYKIYPVNNSPSKNKESIVDVTNTRTYLDINYSMAMCKTKHLDLGTCKDKPCMCIHKYRNNQSISTEINILYIQK